jgi:hypothetical protein
MRTITLLIAFALVFTMTVSAAPSNCATIQRGGIVDSAGNPITTGYDKWGYNYQAMMFNGIYDNYSRPPVPVTSGDSLIMKWNDAWLSNQDCDGDGKLDRHFGFPTYRGSGAWLTNHMTGSYVDGAGKTQHWTYFVKIVAAPLDAVLVGGVWKTAGGIEIGSSIWGEFAVIQEIYNDTGAGDHGVSYKSPASPGFGVYKPN